MHDNWRIQTFMVPAADDPGGLSYGVIGPDGLDRYALFGADGSARSYANVLTLANSVAGRPGLVGTLPPFNFAVVAAEELPSGTYRVGFACTYFGATATYWDTEVVVNSGSGHLRWRLASISDVPFEPGGLGPWTVVVLVVGALAVGAAVWFFLIRRLRHITPRSKESK